ncbi:hypothetical protein AB870_26475 (plasmid) [Pandoraea faecigallinarum]|uniref:Uncharacterized protein n=1 Tax=Pandoraea faecigallinarum TaxID=656179 RepID=A0A1D8X6Q6_9BURK|nr:hypothetical protein AB870_26475 [Pandoraea faecigallinarum]
MGQLRKRVPDGVTTFEIHSVEHDLALIEVFVGNERGAMRVVAGFEIVIDRHQNASGTGISDAGYHDKERQMTAPGAGGDKMTAKADERAHRMPGMNAADVWR